MIQSRPLRLISTIALVAAPLALGQILWRLVYSGSDAAVVNGALRLGVGGLAEGIVTAACWMLMLTAGVIALSAQPEQPLRRAWRLLPLAMTVLLAAAAGGVLAGLVFVLVANVAGSFAAILVVLAGVLMLPVMARIGVVIPAAVHEGPGAFKRAWQLPKGRSWSIGMLIALGVLLPAFGAGFLIDELGKITGTAGSVAAVATRTLIVATVALIQAATLYTAYNLLQPIAAQAQPQPNETPVPVEPAGAVPEMQPAVTGLRASGSWQNSAVGVLVPVVAYLLLPALLTLGVVKSGMLPEVSFHPREQDFERMPSQAVAVAWPDSGNPVAVNSGAIYDCLDERCTQVDITHLKQAISARYGGAAIARSGDVVTVTGGYLQRCRHTTRICDGAPARLSVISQSAYQNVAISTANGAIIIATATEVPDPADPKKTKVQLALVRCDDEFCKEPSVTVFGTIPGPIADDGHDRYPFDSQPRQRLIVGSGSNDQPIVGFRSASSGTVWVGWCATLGCGSHGMADLGGPLKPGAPTADELAGLHEPGFFPCFDGRCPSADVRGTAGSARRGLVAASVELRSPDYWIHVGEPLRPERWLALTLCKDLACAQRHSPTILTRLTDISSRSLSEQGDQPWAMAMDGSGSRVVLAGKGNGQDPMIIVVKLPGAEPVH